MNYHAPLHLRHRENLDPHLHLDHDHVHDLHHESENHEGVWV